MQLRGLQQREGPPLPAVAAGTSSAGGRTVALQILMARGLPASDLNGMSDPYWCPPAEEKAGDIAIPAIVAAAGAGAQGKGSMPCSRRWSLAALNSSKAAATAAPSVMLLVVEKFQCGQHPIRAADCSAARTCLCSWRP